MNFNEIILLTGAVVNSTGLGIVLFKLVWGGASSHHNQFSILEKACDASVAACRNELLLRLDGQSSNLGNVVSNIGNRIHDLELKAAEARAVAAETYMRRDSYHKATDEFKRDVREAHGELKSDMEAGFNKLELSIDGVSRSIEANRRQRVEN